MKNKKLIKALKARIIKVEEKATLATQFLNDMYEAQTKWFIAKWSGEIFEDFKSNL